MSVDEAKRMTELAQILAKDDFVAATSSASSAASGGNDNASSDVPPLIREKLNALDELEMIVESIDNAKNLFIVGGFEPLLDCIRSSSSTDVRRRAADTLAVVVQNNPRAQQWALEAGCLTVLANALAGTCLADTRAAVASSSSSAPTTASLGLRASCLTALSALVRDNKDAQKRLVRAGHLALVLQPVRDWPLFVGSQEPGAASAPLPNDVMKAGRRLARKALFFLRHLVAAAEADAVMTAVVNHEGGILRVILSTILNTPASQSGGLSPDDPDVSDARENALCVLLSLASPTPAFNEVIDDSGDTRRPRPGHGLLQLGGASPRLAAATGSGEAAPMLLLGGPAPSSSAATSTSGAVAPSSTAPAPQQQQPLDVFGRRAVLTSAGVPSLLQSHLEWCDARAANGGDDSDTAKDEAQVTRDILAALGSRG